MAVSLNQQIQQFYDASSGLWESIWGEHMHHGYYGVEGNIAKERRQAQLDLIEELLHWADVQQAARILDVGCGIGGSTLYLAARFQANATGVSLSPVQIDRAQERSRFAGLAASTQFFVADALNMPFADQSFDFIWSLESGEHMPDKTQFMQEMSRVLKPGGTLLMATWCHRSTAQHPLTEDERHHLQEIYRVYCLPFVISLPEYEQIARSLPLNNIRTADWSSAVAPFWNAVIDSTFNPMAILGLLFSSWQTIEAAFSLSLMRDGYDRGLIRYGVLTATKV